MVWAGEMGSEENEIAVVKAFTLFNLSHTVGVEKFKSGMSIAQKSLENTLAWRELRRDWESCVTVSWNSLSASWTSTRRILTCNSEGTAYLYNWDEPECVSTVGSVLHYLIR